MVDYEDMDDEEYEDQLDQMIIENGVLTHAVLNTLIRKGVISREEIDAEVERLYAEAESLGDDEDDDRE